MTDEQKKLWSWANNQNCYQPHPLPLDILNQSKTICPASVRILTKGNAIAPSSYYWFKKLVTRPVLPTRPARPILEKKYKKKFIIRTNAASPVYIFLDLIRHVVVDHVHHILDVEASCCNSCCCSSSAIVQGFLYLPRSLSPCILKNLYRMLLHFHNLRSYQPSSCLSNLTTLCC